MKKWVKITEESAENMINLSDEGGVIRATIEDENGNKKEVDLNIELSNDGIKVSWEE